MSGQINSGSFSKDLLPGVQKFFGLDYAQFETKYDQYFEVKSVTERYAEDMVTHGLGLMKVKGEGQSTGYDSAGQGWLKRYDQVVYSNGFIITREAKDDGHALNLAKDLSMSARRSCVQTIENLCANTLNNAFSSSFTGGDGVSLCNSSHPTYAGNVNYNQPATSADFSEAAFEQMSIDISTWVDQRGMKIDAQPKKLVIPTALRFNVQRVIGNATQRPATADRDINASYDLNICPQGVVFVPWLTSLTAWFAVTDIPKGLRYLERNACEITTDNDFDTENAKFKYRFRAGLGWSDPLGVYGSNGP